VSHFYNQLNQINEEDESKDISLCDEALGLAKQVYIDVNSHRAGKEFIDYDKFSKDMKYLMAILRKLKDSEKAEEA
jgi:hypothetical protein